MDTGIIYAWIDSPVGPVWVAATKIGTCAVRLGTGQPKGLFSWLSKRIASGPPSEDPQALAQLDEYFAGTRHEFDLSLDARGTPFQRAVWAQVTRIPYKTTTTYGEVARRIGHSRAARAVGGSEQGKPTAHHHPLPPGDRCEGRVDRLRRWIENESNLTVTRGHAAGLRQ